MAKHRGSHHGGAWKVAYADFVTAMMALFLVLWLTAQDTRIKEAVERAFRNPFSAVTKESMGIIPNKDVTGLHKQEGQFQSISAVEMETMRRISEDLSRILQQQEESEKSVQLDLTSDGLRINVFDRSHKPIFEPGTDVFTTYGGWVFSTLAWEIARYKSFRIELEGHTEVGTENGHEAHSKWELSAERANAARRKLVQSGMVADQVYKVSGFADTVPMLDLPPDAEANRRVTVLLKLKPTLSQVSASAATPFSQDRHAN
ncbi:MAG TPA: flagellar motor protein MotB [Candidatus Sulfotelmatobacter sp.]|nr:flagellar motor protein MotB [Candidatus Sulfotelmatobacter sp.]